MNTTEISKEAIAAGDELLEKLIWWMDHPSTPVTVDDFKRDRVYLESFHRRFQKAIDAATIGVFKANRRLLLENEKLRERSKASRAALDGLHYASALVAGRRVLNRPAAYLAAP